jgi:CRISPR-associated endoribonuclease Cas6
MLASFLVYLRPANLAHLGQNLGRSLHGLFFELVRQARPDLADQLHQGHGLRPFTVSSLQGKWTWQDNQRLAVPEEDYRVRYTVLTEEVFAALSNILLGKYLYQEPVDIDGQPFEIINIAVEPEQSRGWAKLSSYQQLHDEASTERRIRLQFTSPTTFRTGDVNLLFPLTGSVFRSYMRKWESFSPVPLSVDLPAFIAEYVVEERYRLETKVVSYSRRAQFNGCVGACQYRVLRGDPDKIRELNMLADFALFAGTGQKTTQGMGQTRRVRPWT